MIHMPRCLLIALLYGSFIHYKTYSMLPQDGQDIVIEFEQDMSPQDIAAIPIDVIESWSEPQFQLLGDNITALTPEQIKAINPDVIEQMNMDIVKFTPEQIRNFTNEQIKKITLDLLLMLETDQLQNLNVAQLPLEFFDSLVRQDTASGRVVPQNTFKKFDLLTNDQLRSLSIEKLQLCLSHLSGQRKTIAQQIIQEKINNRLYPAAPKNQVATAPIIEDLEDLTAEIADMASATAAKNQVAIAPLVATAPAIEYFSDLTAAEIAAIPIERIRNFSIDDIDELSDAANGQGLAMLTIPQTQALAPHLIAGLSLLIDQLTPEQIRHLTQQQIQAITADQLISLNRDLLQNLTIAHIPLSTLQTINNINTRGTFNHLTDAQLESLSIDQLQLFIPHLTREKLTTAQRILAQKQNAALPNYARAKPKQQSIAQQNRELIEDAIYTYLENHDLRAILDIRTASVLQYVKNRLIFLSFNYQDEEIIVSIIGSILVLFQRASYPFRIGTIQRAIHNYLERNPNASIEAIVNFLQSEGHQYGDRIHNSYKKALKNEILPIKERFDRERAEQLRQQNQTALFAHGQVNQPMPKQPNNPLIKNNLVLSLELASLL